MAMDAPDNARLARDLAARLQQAGFAAFWVGGCVRDRLLGREPQDYDIATDARPEQVEALFPHTVPVGRQFGVVIVVDQGRQFQVATFRAEADYQDGRRPGHVEFANAQADAARRDFTVNGLFLDPLTGALHDWVGGAADLRARVIRTIGVPAERFGEDHLRLLRAIRFAAQLDFTIEAETFAAIQELAPKIALISAERIREELLKLFRPPHAARGLDLLRDSGLLEPVLPELSATLTCEQSPDHHPEGSVYNHIRLMLAKLPAHAPDELVWSVLLHDIAKPVTAEHDPATGKIHFYGHEKVGAEMAETILTRLKFPRKETDIIVHCVLMHMQFKDVQKMRAATLRRMLMREHFPLELELHRLDCLGSSGNLANYEFAVAALQDLAQRPSLVPPLLTGDDLLRLGAKPGPALGQLLTELRDSQLAEELTTREAAVEWVKRRMV
jgi:poly(A) polymerase